MDLEELKLETKKKLVNTRKYLTRNYKRIYVMVKREMFI